MSDVALPTTFRDKLRESVLERFVDLIPQDQLQNLIDKEVSAFFESQEILTVQPTKVMIDNPNYKADAPYSGAKQFEREVMALSMRMTPFRQIVWTAVYQVLYQKMQEAMIESTQAYKDEFNKWFVETGAPNLKLTISNIFQETALAMAATQQTLMMQKASDIAHQTTQNAFHMAGMSNIAVNIPKFSAPL